MTDITALPIDSDLVFASLYDALDLLNRQTGDIKYHRDHLNVSSQQMEHAIVMAYTASLTVHIDFTYGEDAWSVSRHWLEKEGDKYIERSHTVYSPGA